MIEITTLNFALSICLAASAGAFGGVMAMALMFVARETDDARE